MPYLCIDGVDRCFCVFYQMSGSPGGESRSLNGGKTDSSQVLSCLGLVVFFSVIDVL